MKKAKLLLSLVMILAVVSMVLFACGDKDAHDCKDEKFDHKCDVCEEALSICADENSDHKCDVCGTSILCFDNDNNHNCDICGKELSYCFDNTSDHKCELCGETITSCKDENRDHSCDICGKVSSCEDKTNDHKCDVCEKELSICADENSDHKCDVCEKELSVCKDENRDHSCDICGKVSSCEDKTNDHKCDLCEKALSICADENSDNKCDVCEKVLKETYTISVKSIGGVGFSKVTLLVYDRNTDQLIDAITTEANGIGSKVLLIGDYYATITSGVPNGYKTQDKYYFSSNRTINIVLQSEVISGSHTSYKLGSVMKDFTINTTTGGTFTLSEALKTKDAVLLNFFYTTCSPCVQEFPYLDEAAGMYDNIAVVSVDTMGDTFQQVQSFRSWLGIENIEMGIHSIDLFAAFNASGYPTSVMIDKYGVICLIEVGALPYLDPWTQLFDYFSQDNYTQRLFTSIDEIQ